MGESQLQLQVEILEQGQVVEALQFDDAKIKVGKLATSQLHLDDAKVSRIHAVIERKDPHTYQVIDLGSASGTYLNGEKITKGTAGDGDELRFGETTVRLSVVDPAEVQQPAHQQAESLAPGGQVPEGHIQLEDGTVVQPFTLQGYYDDAGNYIPGYYDEEGTYHYGYGHHDNEGQWQVAHGYYDPQGEWIPTEPPEGQGPSDTELYTENFFNGQQGKILEIAHLWNDQVLDVRTLDEPRNIQVGDHEDNDYVLQDSCLNNQRFPLVVFDPEKEKYRLNFSGQMTGLIQRNGESMPLADAISQGLVADSADVKGAYTIPLSRDTSVRLDFGGNTFLVHFAKLPALAGGSVGVDRTPFVYQTVSLALHAAFMILVFTLPATYGDLELHDQRMQDRFAELAESPEDEEEEELDEDILDEDEPEEEAEAEAPDETAEDEEVEIEGDELDDEEMQEARDREIVQDEGALAAFDDGPQDPLGSAAENALADLDTELEASGVGGMGIDGPGRGGAEGDEGAGRAEAGTPGGTGDGPPGGEISERETVEPVVTPQEPETTGALDREIIQRVVRQHNREITQCYESELQRNPDLSGRIMVSWTISASGDVVRAVVEETTMNNNEVERCLEQRIRQWSFPDPDGGGIVRVNYPFNFSS